jgi:TP901 family phage tail tape measure protein
MADIQSNIFIDIETAQAIAKLKGLQAEISAFHVAMAKGNATNIARSAEFQRELINGINRTGQFSAQMARVATSTETFTRALEGNKLSMGEYFRYAGASTKTFGRFFRSEFETINKVARERVKTLQTQYIKMGRDASGAMQAIAVRPVALDLENYATKAMMAAQKQQLFNQLLRQGSTNLLNFGKNTQWAGRQLMVGFSIPLAMLGTVAAQSFLKMEEQAIRFKRVYGELFTTSEETDKMAKSIQDLAREFTKYGVAVEETMGLAADAAAMGKMGNELLDQVTEATRLAVLGGVDQQKALETTISVTNAFGVATEDLAGKIDFLNAVENQTVVSIEDLTEAIPKAGPVVQQLGGDVEDLAFFLTAMKEGGINASEGANALKSGLASLINPSRQATEMLAGFGINLNGIVEANAGDVKGTVIQFAQALDTLDPLNRARAIEQLFGKFQFSRISTLFQNVIAEGSQAARVLELAGATSEELAVLSERELGRVEESTGYKFKKAMEDLKASLAPIGEEFLKLLTPILGFVNRALEWFNNLEGGVKTFVLGAIAVIGGLGPVFLMTFGLIANGAANLLKLFGVLMGVFTGTGRQSQVLGMQTQYMSQEQLEAAAIAASLDQTHNKLIQTFTTEAGAVNRLTQAYQKAAVAQRAFTGPVIAGGKTIKAKGMKAGGYVPGYADGVVMVPGTKGKGDIVPAMLSPGEAVIPASMAERYRPLITAMIGGKIPGFEDGIDNVGKPRAIRYGASAAGISATVPQQTVQVYGKERAAIELGRATAVAAATEKELLRMRENGTKVTKKQIKAATQLDRAHQISLSDSKTQKTMPTAWAKDAWTVRTGGENNLIADTVRKSTKNQELLKKYLAQTGATQRQASAIMNKTMQGVALSQKELAVQGKALRAIGADYQKGMISAKAISPTFGNYAQAVGKGQLAGEKFLAKNDPQGKGQSTPAAIATAQRKLDEETAKTKTKTSKTENRTAKVQDRVATKRASTAAKAARLPQPTPKTMSVLGPAGVAQAEAQGKNPNRVAGQIAKGAPKTPSAAAPVSQRNQMPRMGGAGMGMMGAGMAAGMMSMVPGQTGQIAGQLAGPLMMAGMAFQMMPAPIAAATVALGALAFGIYKYNDVLNKARKSGLELAASMSMSSEKMKELSEFTGTVSATELRERQSAQLFSTIEPTDVKFGQTFMGSEQGAAMLEDVRVMRESGMSQGDVASNIGRNLTNAMLQGVLTEEQARSIVMALGLQLKDFSIPMLVTAKINSLIGPNGVNLLTDPMSVAVDVQGSAIEEQGKMFEDFTKLAGEMKRSDGYGSIESKIFTGIGLAIGSVVGGLVGTAGANPVSIAAGGIAGGTFGSAAGGEYGAYLAVEKEKKKLAATAIGFGFEALNLGQQQLDVINQSYETQKNELDLALQTASSEEARLEVLQQIDDLDRNYEFRRGQILKQTTLLTEQLRQQAAIVGEKEFSEISAGAVEARYAGTGLETASASASERLADFAPEPGFWGTLGKFFTGYFSNEEGQKEQREQDEEQRVVNVKFRTDIEAAYASGDIDFSTVNALLDAAEADEEFSTKYNLLVEQQGLDTTNTIVALLLQAGLTGDDLQFSVIMDFITNNPEDIETNMEALSYLGRVPTTYGIEVELDGEDAVDKVNEMNGALSDLQAVPDTITKQALIDGAAAGNDTMQRFLDTWGDTIDTDDTVEKSFILEFMALAVGSDWDLVKAYGAAQGMGLMDTFIFSQQPGARDEAAGWMMDFTGRRPGDKPPGTEPPETSTGSGSQSNVYAPIEKSMGLFVDAAKKVSKTSAQALRDIQKFADGAGKAFNGVANQMRDANVGEPLIDFMLGMSPEDFEKEKTRIFTVENKLITGLTAAGEALQAALNTAKLGEFVNEQQQIAVNAKSQLEAFNMLKNAGIEIEYAYKLVQDTSFATALATERDAVKIAQALQVAREAAAAMAKLEAARDAAVAQADPAAERRKRISEMNKEFADRQKFITKMKAQGNSLTNIQIEAIANNKDLMEEFLATGWDGKKMSLRLSSTLRTALLNAAKQEEIDLAFKKLTVSGMQEIFDQGFSNAQTAFSTLEEQLGIELQGKLVFGDESYADAENVVKAAQEQIGLINFEIDGLEADLERISRQEEEINKKYDDKLESLEKINQVNERITRQQESQLNIADALSRGDIAAAARAIQDSRAATAREAQERQKEILEAQREAELGAVRGTSGLSRTELEEQVKKLKEEIFNIEQDIIRPREEVIRLANLQLEKDIESLEVLGMSREEWNNIKNQIDLAKISTDKYLESLQEALNVMQELTGTRGEMLNPDWINNKDQMEKAKAEYDAAIAAGASSKEIKRLKKVYDDAKKKFDTTVKYVTGENPDWRAAKDTEDAAYTAWQNSITQNLAKKERDKRKKTWEDAKKIREALPQYAAGGGSIDYLRMGGMLPYKAMGGSIFKPINTDTVPAMLTPGEFVITRSAVERFGEKNLRGINNGTYDSGSMYNYSVEINVKSQSDASQIADTVIRQIKRIDSQRVRGSKI